MSFWLRWVGLPLARLLRLLGFQLRFWWTLPYPYHPLIALLLPFAPVSLAIWSGYYLIQTGRAPVSSTAFLLSGLLLTIPLSVPIFNAIFVAFRVHLLQGFCFLAGVVTLGAEVAQGVRPLAYAVLPFAYFGLFAVQRIGGPRLIARLQAENTAFVPVDPGARLVDYRLTGSPLLRSTYAQELLEQFGLAWIATGPQRGRRSDLRFRASDEAIEIIRNTLEPVECHADVHGLRIENIEVPGALDAITIRTRGGWSWLVAGNLTVVTVRDGITRQRLSAGRPAPIGNWPLFILAYQFNIFTPGLKGFWVATFRPQPEVVLSDERDHDLVRKTLIRQNPSPQVSGSDMTAVLRPNMSLILRRRAKRHIVLAAKAAAAKVDLQRWLSGEAHGVHLRHWPTLIAQPPILCGRGSKLCAKLTQAKAARDRMSAQLAATLLARLPLDEFISLQDALLPLLSSRILALQWQLTPELDRTGLPVDCPRWGPIAGFGLMSTVPELWERLGELMPPADKVIRAYINEVGERPMLAAARKRMEQRLAQIHST